MTAELIAVIVGAIVSVVLEIVPGLKAKWAKWEWKPMTLLVLFVGTPIAAVLLVCMIGLELPLEVMCGQQGYFDAAILGFTAFLANQGAFFIGVRALPNARARAG